MGLSVKEKAERQWKRHGVAFSIHLAGWYEGWSDELNKKKGRKTALTQISSMRAIQKSRCLKHQQKG